MKCHHAGTNGQIRNREIGAVEDIDPQPRDLALQAPQPPSALQQISWAAAGLQIGLCIRRPLERLIGEQPEFVFRKIRSQGETQFLGIAFSAAARNRQRSRVQGDLHEFEDRERPGAICYREMRAN